MRELPKEANELLQTMREGARFTHLETAIDPAFKNSSLPVDDAKELQRLADALHGGGAGIIIVRTGFNNVRYISLGQTKKEAIVMLNDVCSNFGRSMNE